jgi:hypothetical protein
LKSFNGYCSLILEKTRSHPLTWQMYLRAEHKSFLTLGSLDYANISYLAPITVIGINETFMFDF